MIPIQPLSGSVVVEQALNQLFKPKRANRSASRVAKLGLGLAVLGAPILAALAADAPVPAPTPSTATAAASALSTNSAPVSTPKLTLTKPDWLTDLSISVKETFDDNIFLSDTDHKYYSTVNLAAVRPGVAIAYKDKFSAVTTVSPKVGINFAPLIGETNFLSALTLTYSPDFVNYAGSSSESYNAQRIGVGAKVKADNFSGSIENTFTAIDGSKYGPLYPGSLNSAYATGTVRERRNQYQDRSAATFQYDVGRFFIRPTSSLTYYDLRTDKLTKAQAGGIAGYQNYADRYDVNGGADFGYKVLTNFAATFGYRYGTQYQETYSKAIDNLQLSSSSDYQRLLFGFEGKPIKWLDVKFQGGPDFRSYGDHAPVADSNPVDFYGEASATATISPKNSLTFKYKSFEWVSSTGKVPYNDNSYELSYKHKLTSQLTLDLSAKLSESDYTSGRTAGATSVTKVPNQRDDSDTVFSAGFSYAFNSNASINAGYSYEFGRNFQPGVVNEWTREFDRNLVTIGATFKF